MKKVLYAVAIERLRGYKTVNKKRIQYIKIGTKVSRNHPGWEIDISYLHAKDLTEARFLYTAGNNQEIMNYIRYQGCGRYVGPMRKIINIAPAVGFFIENEKTLETVAE